jgi:ferredoxin-type protein NapG
VSKSSRQLDRRSFFRRTGKALGGAALTWSAVGGYAAFRGAPAAHSGMRGRLGLLRPPGAGDEPDFLSKCIRCTRCSDACEAQCILLFGPEAGALQGTPYIIPEDHACTLCLECGAACPTEALGELEDRTDVRIGVAVVDERLCVSHNGTGVCGACHTACPLKNEAITQDFRNQPTVHANKCVGCGLCEEVCIVKDRKAIQVMSERVQV